jgi:hypothetical protein
MAESDRNYIPRDRNHIPLHRLWVLVNSGAPLEHFDMLHLVTCNDCQNFIETCLRSHTFGEALLKRYHSPEDDDIATL